MDGMRWNGTEDDDDVVDELAEHLNKYAELMLIQAFQSSAFDCPRL